MRSVSTINRFKSLLRHASSWAVDEELIERSPVRRRHRPVHEDGKRDRVLSFDEEKALLEHASPELRNLIIGALDTGTRRGEMLSITIEDLDVRPGWIRLRGSTTKSAKTRFVPIATERLRQVLAWQRLDVAGLEKPAGAFVFCNGVGQRRRKDSFRTAFRNALRKANITPDDAGDPASKVLDDLPMIDSWRGRRDSCQAARERRDA